MAFCKNCWKMLDEKELWFIGKNGYCKSCYEKIRKKEVKK